MSPPVYSGTDQVSQGFKRVVQLPALPRRTFDAPSVTADQMLSYLQDLDRSIIDIELEDRRRLQVFVNQRGSAAFGAADTAVAVAFESDEADSDYVVFFSPSWNTKVWYSAVASTGFTMNASDAPGGAGGTVKWMLAR